MGRIVVALGGNGLLKRGEPMTAENQRRNARIAAEALAGLCETEQTVITHGNGPQVGLLALQEVLNTDIEDYPLDVLELREQGESLRAALATLTPGERQAIETTFFAGLTHAEAATRLNLPLEVKALVLFEPAIGWLAGSAAGMAAVVMAGAGPSLALVALALNTIAWLPNGKGFVVNYNTRENGFQRAQLGFVSYPGGVFSPITNDTNTYGFASISADGKTIATVQRKDLRKLYIVPATGFASRRRSTARMRASSSRRPNGLAR